MHFKSLEHSLYYLSRPVEILIGEQSISSTITLLISHYLQEALEAEKLSEEEAERQKKRLKESEDEALRLDAEQKEKLARLHAKGSNISINDYYFLC